MTALLLLYGCWLALLPVVVQMASMLCSYSSKQLAERWNWECSNWTQFMAWHALGTWRLQNQVWHV